MIEINKIYQGDCLEVMKDIDDKSIHCIICDLPYQLTNCEWDTIIPFEPLWAHYKRIIKDNGAIVLTGSQPFTTDLINSNREWFRYEWIWEKEQGTNFATTKYIPYKVHENILIFYKNKPIYNPQMSFGTPYVTGKSKKAYEGGGFAKTKTVRHDDGLRYPRSILRFNREVGLHPTQKPVALYEYLIKTYTNEGDLMLDNAAGSCTLAEAAIKTNRNWICIEQEEKYCKLGQERIDKIKHIQRDLF